MKRAMRGGNRQKEHSTLVNRLLLAGDTLPGVLLFKNPTGLFLSLDGKRKIKIGEDGQGDIIGIVATHPICPHCQQRYPQPIGRAFWAEAKTGDATPQSNQNNFAKVIREYGGIYIIAHDQSDLLQSLKQVLRQ